MTWVHLLELDFLFRIMSKYSLVVPKKCALVVPRTHLLPVKYPYYPSDTDKTSNITLMALEEACYMKISTLAIAALKALKGGALLCPCGHGTARKPAG